MNTNILSKEESKSTAVKIDQWLWPESPVGREVKATQHMTPRCFNLKMMFAFRVTALIMLVV